MKYEQYLRYLSLKFPLSERELTIASLEVPLALYL